MKEKISIIVPAYNVQKDIQKCLSSITNQTYKNIEIIVINDGSTDNTGNIIDQCADKDSRIKVLHKKNEGVTLARLEGVQKSTGEYIGFVDGDDFIESDMYEHLLNNMKKYNADISHCGYVMVYPNRKKEYFYNTQKIVIQNHKKGIADLLSGEFIEPGLWNKLFKKELLIRLIKEQKLDYSIKINEDLLMNYYLFNYAKKSIYEDFCPYYYVLRKDSATKTKINKFILKDPMKVIRILKKNTFADKDIYYIVQKRWIRNLINISYMPQKENKELIIPYQREIRIELKKEISNIMRDKHYSKKLKIMALWTAICPVSYRWVHRLYEKITGLDEKYKVE